MVDWVIVAFVLMLALRGYERGFIVGALSLAGFFVGALIGARLAPLVALRRVLAPRTPPCSASVAQSCSEPARSPARARWQPHGVRVIRWLPGFKLLDGMPGPSSPRDRLGLVWIAGALCSNRDQLGVSAALRRDIGHSAILRALKATLPPSGPILSALDRIDPLPAITGPLPTWRHPPGDCREAGVTQASPPLSESSVTRAALGLKAAVGWRRLRSSSPTLTSSRERLRRSCRSAAMNRVCRRPRCCSTPTMTSRPAGLRTEPPVLPLASGPAAGEPPQFWVFRKMAPSTRNPAGSGLPG